MLSACQGVVDAKLLTDDRIAFDRDFDTGLCWGAFSVINIVTDVASDPPNRYSIFGVCAPKGVSRSQSVRIFAEYANRNLQRLHEEFFWVARDALREVFPCPKSGLPKR